MVNAFVRFLPGPLDPSQAVAWLMREPGGAVHVVATRAKPPGLEATPRISDAELELRCREAVAGLPLHGIVLLHATGPIASGLALAVVGAAADHRGEAFEAVDRLLACMKGVAERKDAPA